MLTNDQELSLRITGFLRRKEAKYPELAQPPKRERLLRDPHKPTRLLHWSFGISTHS
ncbi:MAG: hypothetical protein AAB834_02390 [Patescibacteria group bacterium]